MAKFAHSGWRRVLAGVLAYALVLQGFIVAFDIGRPASAAPNGVAWAGFELCSHNADSALPGVPAQGPIGNIHCVFCVAGAVFLNCLPPSTPQYSKATFTDAVWHLTTPRLATLVVTESAWPRGPPTAA